MKILHTSDWHLGRSLYGKRRYDEFERALDWMAHTIEEENINIVLIAGDIFDTGTPSNRAQEIYYRFLSRVSLSNTCEHIVIIAGNHDSPSFLNAPKALLRALRVHVVAAITDNPEDEVLVLENRNGEQVIVCAVPYLRDKDVRTVEAGESFEDKTRKLVAGIQQHYQLVIDAAQKKQAEITQQSEITPPIIAMGHLFTAGGQTVDGDGVRELYVGSLAHVGPEIFSDAVDYAALGHLHVPQTVSGQEHIRYSGSPLPMGFGEAEQQKTVVIVTWDGTHCDIVPRPVPAFRTLKKISGTVDELFHQIEQLKTEQKNAWLEIEYTGNEIVGNLREILNEAVLSSSLEIVRIRNRQIVEQALQRVNNQETLETLSEHEVFDRCLETHAVPEEERRELRAAYTEIVNALHEDDTNAE